MQSIYKDITFDRKTKRFKYPDGKFATQEAVIYQASKYLKEQQARLIRLGSELNSRPSDLNIQREIGDTLREIHIVGAVIAAKGRDKLYANDYLIIARNLRSQYGLSDNMPDEYGLSFIFKEITSGAVKPARLIQRFEMYAKSVKTTIFGIERQKKTDQGLTEARRILGNGEHCAECRTYSNYGWVGIDKVILPTQQCSCLTNCLCRLEYR